MTIPNYAIGAAVDAVYTLTTLGLPIPKADAVDYAEYIENGAGELIGQGWLVARWRFAVLTTAQQTTLATYEGESYLYTLEQDGTYGLYHGYLVLPPRKAPKAGQLLDYVVELRKLTVPT